MEHTKKYWKGFEELTNSPDFVQNKDKEFAQDLPVLSELGGMLQEQQATRRDFLKVLGFSLGAATIAASCEIPVKKIIPYVNKPNDIIPGIANYYASTFAEGGDYCSILVKTREGRPVKVEGNELSSLTQGGTSARAQASVLSLYDSARLRYPKRSGQKKTWAIVDTEIQTKLAGAGNIVILSGPIISPSTRQAIAEFKNKYPNTRHISYSPVSKAGILTANEKNFGKRVVPSYNLASANVIVSLGADFLGTWVAPVEFAKEYTKRRAINRENPTMSKHWQFESYMSLTGANADKRLSIRPSEEGTVALALYNELAKLLGGSPAGNAVIKDEAVKKGIVQAAMELSQAKGSSLIVSGSNNPAIQEIVNAMNAMLGNYGTTIDINRPYTAFSDDDKAMNELVAQMNGGQVGAIILYHVNPGYSYPNAAQFLSGLKKVGLSISFSDREDETSEAVTYLCPDSHYLESWNDAEPKQGFYSLAQPTIPQLFDTRQAQESLLKWAGQNTTYYDFIQNYWRQNILNSGDFQAAWGQALHDGIYEPAKGATAAAGASPSVDVAGAASALAAQASKANGVELHLYETVTIGDGRYAANPFLQETPEPISKVCWDNFIAMSQRTAREQHWEEYDLIEVKVGNTTVQLPLIFQPGQAYGTASIPLGYGRTKAGSEYFNVGQNAYPFLGYNGTTFDYNVLSGVTLTKVGSAYALPRTQTHHTIDDARPVVREASLKEYQKNKYAGNDFTVKMKNESDKFFTLYGEDPVFGSHADKYKGGLHWALTVDLTNCIGCGACVTSCNVENNIPIVGKNEVFRAHEMHWMRIDRYYSSPNKSAKPDSLRPNDVSDSYLSELEHPDVTFMPMMCHHCDNAPCENVCPVAATNHSAEGINQMAYNRCIGTRYCANNCPYKVRRFNWFDYQGADSFYKNTIFNNDEYVMVDDLTRMVLNPDVTVRSRGVMEKCSFCIQRIQEGKLAAKRDGRALGDGEIKTACQTACPTNAITFGDRNDKATAVSTNIANERNYILLEEIHVVPSVSYLVQLRNREEEVAGEAKVHLETKEHGHDSHHGAESGHDNSSHDSHATPSDSHDAATHEKSGH